MAARQRFEHYASRINLFLFAGIVVWQILHGRGLIQVFFLVGIVRMAASGFDLPRERTWWFALAFCGIGAAALLGLPMGGPRSPEDRMRDVVLTALLAAQAGRLGLLPSPVVTVRRNLPGAPGVQ